MSLLKRILLSEKDAWILWVPVFFGVGIILYFALPFEPSIRASALAMIAALAACCFTFRRKTVFWIMVILSICIAGFLAGQVRTLTVAAPILHKETGVKRITATISEVHPLPHGKRFVLDTLTVEGMPPEQTPKRIRLNINTDSADAKPGDIVSALAILQPPPIPVIPGGYDFALYAYFQQIGAVGYVVSPITIQTAGTTSSIARIRNIIVGRILAQAPGDSGNVTTALLVGEDTGINKKTMSSIRTAGIAHILAVSGTHLTLVAAIFFFCSRALLASFGALTLRYNIKKWAALIAMCGSFYYLLLTGAPVSAQRAFIMTSLILIAILIDRTGAAMRSIALAAMLILIVMPESILTPSFQMSFAAVMALISSYDLTKSIIHRQSFGPVGKFFAYFISLVASSLVASIATAPFSIYFFNNFSSYGLIANLICIPVTSFIIMPFGVLSMLLMPLSLEKLALIPTVWGVDILIWTANTMASLPQSVGIIAKPPVISFALVVIGGIWLVLWQTRLRLWGLLPIIIGICLSFSITVPDIMVGAEGKLFAVKDVGNSLIFSSKTREKYTREIWQKAFNEHEVRTITDSNNIALHCDSLACRYTKNDITATIAKHPLALQQDCGNSNLLINLTHSHSPCKATGEEIKLWQLRQNGAYFISLENGHITIENVAQTRGNRPWSIVEEKK